ncbi:MAG TPA: hypothetical protein VFE61_20075, partial [Candidatus Sulfotelmatobacter sp.]|nr:hypothetical protein [Candidatus Sulfotelmatobacter sp.]
GKVDIFVNNDATPNYLYKNEGKGKFTEIGLESGTAVSQDGAEQACMGGWILSSKISTASQ